MKNKNITFIGAGNMGGAILSGLINKKLVEVENITVFDAYVPTLNNLQEKYGVNITHSENLAVENADIVILAVKPNIIDEVLEKIKTNLKMKCIYLLYYYLLSFNYMIFIYTPQKKKP